MEPITKHGASNKHFPSSHMHKHQCRTETHIPHYALEWPVTASSIFFRIYDWRLDLSVHVIFFFFLTLAESVCSWTCVIILWTKCATTHTSLSGKILILLFVPLGQNEWRICWLSYPARGALPNLLLSWTFLTALDVSVAFRVTGMPSLLRHSELEVDQIQGLR